MRPFGPCPKAAPPLLVDVAHDGQEQKCAGVVDAVRIVRVDCVVSVKAPGPFAQRRAPSTTSCARNARQFFGLFRRGFFDVRLVGFKTVRPFLDEGLVVRFSLMSTRHMPAAKATSVPDAGLQVNVRDLSRLRAAGSRS